MNEKLKRILLVESDQFLSMNLVVALSTGLVDRAVINICRTCENALATIRRQQTDLVIVNNQLICHSGGNFVSELHRIIPDMPVIFLTNAKENVAMGITENDKYINIEDLSQQQGLGNIYETVFSALRMNGHNNKSIADEQTSKAKVLVMDDDPNLLRIYRKALRKENYDVEVAITTQLAQELIENNKFDIFVCDIQVGKERGTDLLEKMKQKLHEDQTQTILCSAYGQYRYMSENVGADFFLEKPISLGTLMTLIERLVADHQPALMVPTH